MDLSLNLKGVVAQQLIPTPDGRSRRVAMEIMLGTPLVQDYIRDGEIHKLKEIMKESTNLGMRTFDQSLFELYQAGEISYEDALRYADSQNEVRLRIKLSQGRCQDLVAGHGWCGDFRSSISASAGTQGRAHAKKPIRPARGRVCRCHRADAGCVVEMTQRGRRLKPGWAAHRRVAVSDVIAPADSV